MFAAFSRAEVSPFRDAGHPLVTLLLSRAFWAREDLGPRLIAAVTGAVCDVLLLLEGSYSAWYMSHDSRAAATIRSPSSASSSRSATSRSAASTSRAAQASRDA
jgi:hypothetical protein